MNDILERLKNESSLAQINPQTQLSEWALSKISGLAAGEVNKIFTNSALAGKVMKFVKTIKQQHINIIEEKNGVELSIFRFPIVPANIKVSNGYRTEVIDTIAGKINYFKSKELKEISFSSFFPSVFYPFSEDIRKFGWSYAEEIERLCASGVPIKLVITGMGLVIKCYVKEFSPETTTEGDVEYSIKFEEARDPSIYETESKYYTYKPEAYMTKDKWGK